MKKFLLCILICMIALTACADDANSFKSFASPTHANRCKTENEDLCEYGVLTDSRDGQSYKTVKIGSQWWMAENLNFESVNSYCLDDDVAKCAIYGRIYIWSAALSACPEGWHLPTIDEFDIMVNSVYGGPDALTSSSINCGRRAKCSDYYGFSVIPAGYITINGSFGLSYEETSFWSSSEYDFLHAYAENLNYDGRYGVYSSSFIKYSGMSVRCLKGEATSRVQGSSLLVNNYDGMIEIFDVNGILVGRKDSNGAVDFYLNRSGTYIVKMGRSAQKVVVK